MHYTVRTWSSDVAPVHVIRPDDQIDAVVYGRLSFIVTIPFSRRNSTLRPFNAISRRFKWHRTLNEHTTLLITISISGSGSASSVCSTAPLVSTIMPLSVPLLWAPLLLSIGADDADAAVVTFDAAAAAGNWLLAASVSFNGFGMLFVVVVVVVAAVVAAVWCGCTCKCGWRWGWWWWFVWLRCCWCGSTNGDIEWWNIDDDDVNVLDVDSLFEL